MYVCAGPKLAMEWSLGFNLGPVGSHWRILSMRVIEHETLSYTDREGPGRLGGC